MSSKEYLLIFADGVRKRHFHVTSKGKITKFAVQLEVDLKGEWKPILGLIQLMVLHRLIIIIRLLQNVVFVSFRVSVKFETPQKFRIIN